MEDFLKHIGVLGMRWGKRKTKPKSSSSNDYKNKVLIKKKKLHEMSNQELRSLNERMQLERQYKELNKVDVSAGRQFINDMVYGIAKQTVTDYVRRYANRGVEELFKKVTRS